MHHDHHNQTQNGKVDTNILQQSTPPHFVVTIDIRGKEEEKKQQKKGPYGKYSL